MERRGGLAARPSPASGRTPVPRPWPELLREGSGCAQQPVSKPTALLGGHAEVVGHSWTPWGPQCSPTEDEPSGLDEAWESALVSSCSQ